jgi:hypothetical protein
MRSAAIRTRNNCVVACEVATTDTPNSPHGRRSDIRYRGESVCQFDPNA